MLDLKIDPMAFGIYQCPREWIVNEKGTVFHRLYYVYEGETLFTDGYRELPLKKAHLYLFPINKSYNIIHNPDNPLKCMFFHIATCPLILDPMICIDIQNFPALFHMIRTLEHILQNTSHYLSENRLLLQLLNSLIIILDSEIHLHFSDENKLLEVLEYIHIHYAEKLTNDQLSRIAGFDRCYFARLFRKLFGVSPQEYISNYRFIKAAYLIQKNLPIKQVAGLIGFQDEKAFSRAFKKAYGCPPTVYRGSQFLQP